MTEDERLEAINQIANGYGMSLLDMVDGDWRLALSVSIALLGSTLAQTALALEEDPGPLLEDSQRAVGATALAFYEKLSTNTDQQSVEKTNEKAVDNRSREVYKAALRTGEQDDD